MLCSVAIFYNIFLIESFTRTLESKARSALFNIYYILYKGENISELFATLYALDTHRQPGYKVNAVCCKT